MLSTRKGSFCSRSTGDDSRILALVVNAVISGVLTSILCLPCVYATKLPGDLKDEIAKDFPGVRIRLDGSFATKAANLYLPWIPPVHPAPRQSPTLSGSVAKASEPNLLSFANGWFFLKVEKTGKFRYVMIPPELPVSVRQALLNCKLPADLIVPEHFVLPTSLKPTVGELKITFVDDARLSLTEAKPARSESGSKEPKRWGIFVSSPSSGKITLLEESSLTKLAEFPTEGTPGGLAYADDTLFIADQSKNRVLKLDPNRCQFIGQIDLPKHSAPKGLAALPNGKLLYVSESGTGNVAVFEVENDHLLVRTKVLAGPGRMAVTPNGNILLVLNAPAGRVTLISTQNQKVLATVQVGTLPNAIAISSDSQRAYVSNRVSNNISVIDIARHQVIETLATGAGPTGIALDAEGTRLFVANAKDNTMSVLDLKHNKKLEEIKLPLDVDFPGALTLLPNGHELLVSSETTEAIGLFDVVALAFEKQPVIGHPSDEFLRVPLKEE